MTSSMYLPSNVICPSRERIMKEYISEEVRTVDSSSYIIPRISENKRGQ